MANGQDGVAVSNVNVSVSTGQNGNTIGGTTPGTRNVISGNGQGGILIQSSTETLVEGNYIGTDQKGSLSLPNNNQQYGIWVLNSGGPNTIGGTVPGSCNVISGNGYGVLLALSSSTLIEGNLIGTDVTGQSALGNDVGVLIFGASENTVGGSDASAENVISGNTSCGIEIIGQSSTDNQFLGNRIGPVLSGDKAFRSGSTDPRNPWLQPIGVLIIDSVENTIGSTTATSGNVIAGNNVGVEITGFNASLSGSNFVIGNDIGIASDGTGIGNVIGIWVNDVPSTQIGYPGIGNDIADNTEAGVYIIGANASGNLVEGNSIGLGPDDRPQPRDQDLSHEPLPDRGLHSEFLIEHDRRRRGGAGNTISGNNVGVYIVGTDGSSTNNQVLGNFIGLSVNGRSRPGNVLYGVILVNAPNNNVPQSGPSANKIVGSGIANFREFSGAVATTTAIELGPGLGLKGEEAGAPFQSCRASIPAAHGTPRAVTVHGHTGACRPAPETPGSSPPLSDPPLRPDHRHGADEDRAGDHPARGGSSD